MNTVEQSPTVHQHYLDNAYLESTVTVESQFGFHTINTKYSLMEYTLVALENNPDKKAALDVYGEYTCMLSEEFLEAANMTVERSAALLQDEVSLTGLPFVFGVNKPNRYYSVVNNTVREIAKAMYYKTFAFISPDRFEVVDTDQMIILHELHGKFFADLVNIGVPENIAFKIMVSLAEYEDSSAHLQDFLAQGSGFQYDASNHLTMFEMYVYLAELFGTGLATSLLELYNNSMERATQLWTALRRGGDKIFQHDLKPDVQNLDDRASSALLVMLERGSLSDYHTGTALIRLLHHVDWDTIAIEIEDYKKRLTDNGVVAKLTENFRQVSSEETRLILAESKRRVPVKSDAKKIPIDNPKQTSENFLAVDVPLLANIADDQTLHDALDTVYEYSSERKGKWKSSMSLLYAYLYWSSQGLGDMPMDWIDSMLHEEDESAAS